MSEDEAKNVPEFAVRVLRLPHFLKLRNAAIAAKAVADCRVEDGENV
jgi:hypothetical protein